VLSLLAVIVSLAERMMRRRDATGAFCTAIPASVLPTTAIASPAHIPPVLVTGWGALARTEEEVVALMNKLRNEEKASAS
jgi:hypothetical protein